MPIANQYDFEAVLDDARIGNDPSPGYLKRVEVLDSVVRNCMLLSRQYGGIPSPSTKHYFASLLFTALVTRGVSLAIAAPHTPWARKEIEHWDYSTATGIARTILELRLAFFYLCTDVCSDDEWACRLDVFKLHDCITRKRLFESRQTEPEQVTAFEKQAEELRELLRANAHFTTLASKQRSRFLRGETAYLYALEDICEKAGIDKPTFRWLHILFSSHVHGLPMSFFRIGAGKDERGRGLPSNVEESYTSLCLSISAAMLVATHDELETLFKGSEKRSFPDTFPGQTRPEEALETPESFPVGKTQTIYRNAVVRIDVTRTNDTSLAITYFHEPSNEIVLRRSVKNDSSALDFYDQTFWNVLVNGEPATDAFLDGIEAKKMAFRIDPDKRLLHFKIEKQTNSS